MVVDPLAKILFEALTFLVEIILDCFLESASLLNLKAWRVINFGCTIGRKVNGEVEVEGGNFPTLVLRCDAKVGRRTTGEPHGIVSFITTLALALALVPSSTLTLQLARPSFAPALAMRCCNTIALRVELRTSSFPTSGEASVALLFGDASSAEGR